MATWKCFIYSVAIAFSNRECFWFEILNIFERNGLELL